MTSDQREKRPLSCGTAQNISHPRLRYPLGTWNTRVSRRFGRIRELPLLLASRLQGQDPPSLGWTYYDSLGPASDGPAFVAHLLKRKQQSLIGGKHRKEQRSLATAPRVQIVHKDGTLKNRRRASPVNIAMNI